MATASFTTSRTEPPVTYKLAEEGRLQLPMQIEITTDGTIFTMDGAPITLEELESIAHTWAGEIEFIADANAPAGRLLEIHAIVTQQNRQAAFRVLQLHASSP
ncbi:MAG: hypothetical protein OXE92_05325 [Bacteroidetes bacterium]|nr:hypothetical protein [Bacteroidota bacterium]MCY4205130.1 hypothetical protein [Bacteroidota bacterium]